TAGTFGPWGEALVGFTVAALAGTAALVWLRPTLSARLLRCLEAVNFGMLALLLSYWHYHVLLARPSHGFEGPAHEKTWILYGDFIGLFNWAMIMILFGLYLPQTPRRCGLFMAVELVAANAVTVAAAQASLAVSGMLSVLLLETAQALLGGAA